jgi:hypothetical protein
VVSEVSVHGWPSGIWIYGAAGACGREDAHLVGARKQREGEGVRASIYLKGPTPNGLLFPTKLHLLKFPPPPNSAIALDT